MNLRTEIPKLNLEDKVDFKGRALIQSHNPHPPPTRSSAVKNGFRGCSGSAQELSSLECRRRAGAVGSSYRWMMFERQPLDYISLSLSKPLDQVGWGCLS